MQSLIDQHVSPQMLQENGLAFFICIVLVLLVNFILKRLFHRFGNQKNFKKLNLPKLHLILDAISKPLRVYLWMLIAFYAIYFVAIELLDFNYDSWFSKFVIAATLSVLVWISFRFIKRVEQYYILRLPKASAVHSYSFEVSGVKALSRLAQVCVLMVFVLILFGVLQIPLSGLITVGGIGGIAVAYAAKDLLSNFLGGMMIYMNRQFAVGDGISSPDRDIAGTIEQMGWCYTTIRRNDRQIMYVPNSLFSNVLLVNSSRMSHRLISQTFGIRYSDISKIPTLFQELRAYLDQNPDVDHAQNIQVNISGFAASSVNFTMAMYMSVLDKNSFNQVQDALFLKVAEIVEKNSAEFAFPTMTLDLPADFKK